MTSKIFNSILSVAIAVLIASFIITTGVLYQYFGNLQISQLKDSLSLAANATEQLGEDYLENLDSSRYRLTWIDADGTVIYDSHADISSMENHADREEIKEALLYGTGSSTRKSSTLTQKTIYEAIKLNDGSVLRISVSGATALVLVIGMLQPIAIIIIIAIILSAWLAHRMAKRVVEPLNKLDFDNPGKSEVYDELSPLLTRIQAQKREIKEQVWALKCKQDEFDQITGNMKEALVLLDNTYRILSINPAAKTLFGADFVCIGEDFLAIDRKQNMRQAIEKANSEGLADFRSE